MTNRYHLQARSGDRWATIDRYHNTQELIDWAYDLVENEGLMTQVRVFDTHESTVVWEYPPVVDLYTFDIDREEGPVSDGSDETAGFAA